MDLREVGYDDREWINFAQDRDQWRAYVMGGNEPPDSLKVTDVETLRSPRISDLTYREARSLANTLRCVALVQLSRRGSLDICFSIESPFIPIRLQVSSWQPGPGPAEVRVLENVQMLADYWSSIGLALQRIPFPNGATPMVLQLYGIPIMDESQLFAFALCWIAKQLQAEPHYNDAILGHLTVQKERHGVISNT
ncbi:hypothetical protein ANN_01261 [Periplaneta americana]|uniref:Uncharacterized protein n=1 Tax=Periplaneta americana TaxID=6978 RepID=A0ABQ8TW39_PERAM|nr:hypothetical protein ANN_01261 [Periplaneta americana]